MLACTALPPWLHTLEQLDLVLRSQGDHSFPPPRRMLDAVPLHPFGLAFNVDDVHLSHVHAERLLHRLLDLVLVGAAADLEHVLIFAAQTRHLLSDERPQEDVQRVDRLRHRLRLPLRRPRPPAGGPGLLAGRFGGRLPRPRPSPPRAGGGRWGPLSAPPPPCGGGLLGPPPATRFLFDDSGLSHLSGGLCGGGHPP